MICVCPVAQVRNLGCHLWLFLSSLLSRSLNTWEGGEHGSDPEKNQHLRSRRRIFKRRREAEMGGKLGMLPEASLKWWKRVLRSTECHQTLNQLIFVLMGYEKGNNFLETQYLKTGSWGKSIWVREYISHSPVEAKASCLLMPTEKYIQGWEMSDKNCN